MLDKSMGLNSDGKPEISQIILRNNIKKWQEIYQADLDYHQVFTRLKTGETRHLTAQLVPDRLIEEFPTLAELERVILENSSRFTLA